MATDVRLQYYGAQYGQIISVLLVVSAIAAFAAAGFGRGESPDVA